MHHPEQRFVYYGFSQVQPTKVLVEGTFIYHTFSLCFLLSFMASRAKISSDPAVLLLYKEGLSCDSESNDDFDGYLGPEDGPVACATVPEVIEREGLCSPVYGARSRQTTLPPQKYQSFPNRYLYELRITHARSTF